MTRSLRLVKRSGASLLVFLCCTLIQMSFPPVPVDSYLDFSPNPNPIPIQAVFILQLSLPTQLVLTLLRSPTPALQHTPIIRYHSLTKVTVVPVRQSSCCCIPTYYCVCMLHVMHSFHRAIAYLLVRRSVFPAA